MDVEGEWVYDEGCLSVPGLYFPILRPHKVTLRGVDLDGNDFTRVGEELLGRVFLHETDHLDGFLLLDRLAPEIRKEAMRVLREEPARGGVSRRIPAPEPDVEAEMSASAPCVLVFLGSPVDALPPLRALHDAGHEIALVVTQPDRRRGRGCGFGTESGQTPGH